MSSTLDGLYIPEFPKFDMEWEGSEASPDPKLALGLIVVGVLLLTPADQRRSPEVREIVMCALAAFEDRQRTLDELERYADGLECDSQEEFRDAGVFLRRAVREFQQAVEPQDEYAFASVYRSAVGAVEEIARHSAGDGRFDLRRALTKLYRDDRISQEDREWLVELYDLRNTRRGLGHGAGRCPEYVASFALSAVLRGLEALIPSLALSAREEPVQAPMEQ